MTTFHFDEELYFTTVQSTLDAITATLERYGVIVFRDPTPGARLA
jgi:hypothetical protein